MASALTGRSDIHETKATQTSASRQRSTVAFPYSPLHDAEAIAKELHDTWGGTTTVHQLAGGMGSSPRGGTFRTKLATSRIFGATQVSKGTVSLTDLGRRLLDPQTRAVARVEAVVAVPLFAQLLEEYKSTLLPPASGLERKICDLGVSDKQARKARTAFLRSAEEAGYFKYAKNRLVRPARSDSVSRLAPPSDDSGAAPSTNAQPRRSDDDLPGPLVELWLTLLRDGRSWSAEKTQEYVEAARKLQDLLAPKANEPRAGS